MMSSRTYTKEEIIDKTFRLGTFYNPATKHYDNDIPSVTCISCKQEHLFSSIGWLNYDLCLKCVESEAGADHDTYLTVRYTNEHIDDRIFNAIYKNGFYCCSAGTEAYCDKCLKTRMKAYLCCGHYVLCLACASAIDANSNDSFNATLPSTTIPSTM